MSEKRFTFGYDDGQWGVPLFYDDGKKLCFDDVVDLLNEQQATNDYLEEANSRLQVQLGETLRLVDEQQATISKLEEEKGYWKSKAMTLLMQVRRLTPRMTAKEVIEFGKELEDE